MANKKSSEKDIRKIAKNTARNNAVKSKIKTLSKKLTQEKTAEAANALISTSDKAVKKGIIHKNKASRVKSKASKVIFA